jgi:hypothetical protein
MKQVIMLLRKSMYWNLTKISNWQRTATKTGMKGPEYHQK